METNNLRPKGQRKPIEIPENDDRTVSREMIALRGPKAISEILTTLAEKPPKGPWRQTKYLEAARKAKQLKKAPKTK